MAGRKERGKAFVPRLHRIGSRLPDNVFSSVQKHHSVPLNGSIIMETAQKEKGEYKRYFDLFGIVEHVFRVRAARRRGKAKAFAFTQIQNVISDTPFQHEI